MEVAQSDGMLPWDEPGDLPLTQAKARGLIFEDPPPDLAIEDDVARLT